MLIRLIAVSAALLAAAGCMSSGSGMSDSGARTGQARDAAASEPMTAMAYVSAAGAADLFEIQSSQVALQRAQSADVKAFAQMMIDHHTKTSADLMASARQAGLNPPPPALTADKAQQVASLQQVSGAGFDRAYLSAQVAAHQQALALHQGYQANGDQPMLRAAAGKTVPIVRTHLERAQSLAGRGG